MSVAEAAAEADASCSRHACGIETAWTQMVDAVDAVAALRRAVTIAEPAQLVVFFSPQYRGAVLADALGRAFPGVPFAGCTTSGGIAAAGAVEHGITLIAIPADGFRVATTCLRDVRHLEVAAATTAIRTLRRDLDALCLAEQRGRFALTLIDGLTNSEETLVSAVTWALDGIPLVGGSAGDDLRFADTELLFDGTVLRGAAIVILVDCDFPVQLFKTDNFEPTATKFVVTASDDEARIVHELNAEPAAREYALAVGLNPDELTPMSFAAHPLVVKVGGEYFCRSIQHFNADGSLSFFCAISEGVVMTLARPRDIVQATRDELERVDRLVGGIDLVIGFECVLRRLDAQARQVSRSISDLYRRFNVTGCETYGEQFGAMHLNQTFTGIAIGTARDRQPDA